jgi:aminoglycoside 6-adenylyltransferase
MNNFSNEDDVLRRLIRWAEPQEAIRAVIMTSSRCNPDALTDRFSDYDLILAVRDIHPFFEERTWLGDFGKVLVVYRNPIQLEYACERFAYITQYEDGTKIDFTFWSVELLRRIAGDQKLPDELDVGYAVLLDKDHLTSGLKPPTYRAHIPTPPTETEFRNIVEEFFHEMTYVAKHLCRDDLMPAKYNLWTGIEKSTEIRHIARSRKYLRWGWD